MPANSTSYAHRYYLKKRRSQIAKLGGKCEACEAKENLVIHRIYTMMNTKGLRDNSQKHFKFRKDDKTIERFMTRDEINQLRINLLHNPDNQLLLCRTCHSALEKIHGRKNKIGRKEIGYLKGVF